MRRPKRRREAQQVTFAAPLAGLIEDQPVLTANTLGAVVLENFLPTTRGVKVRGGTKQIFDAGSDASFKSMFNFNDAGDEKLFAASDGDIFEASNSAAEDSPSASGFDGGYWSAQQLTTSGGTYLVCVNGEDLAQLYDGTDFNPLTDEAVNELDFDGQTAAFSIGETLTGGTSGATAEILGITQSAATSGTLKLGAITGGPYQNNEALTSAAGAAVANGANSVANSITFTGVDTDSLSHVWLYQNRLFFVEADSLKAWYLPSASVGGAALEVSLAGIFRRGGKLLLGGTWSLDSGDGLDDKCVFVSDQGEIAIYSGSDPSDAATWSFEGRYDIGQPLGKLATAQIGGDFLIATDVGIIPVSAAIQRDPAQLALAAVSRNIKPTWDVEVARSGGHVQLVRWTDGDQLLVLFPDATRIFSANLQTTAWAIQSGGWYGSCIGLYEGNPYVGRTNGLVLQVDEGGLDNGAAFTCKLCYQFADMNAPLGYKSASMMRGSFFADDDFAIRYSVATDYQASFPTPPSAIPGTSSNGVWDEGTWGTAVWGKSAETSNTGLVGTWESVFGSGSVLAPAMQITSGNTARLLVEIVRVDMIAEIGGRVT